MSNTALHDFIATVPICLETNRLACVLSIFSQGQCDRVVVVSEQQCPIGVLHLKRLMPQLMNSYGCKVSLDVQQPLFELDAGIVEPIVTLPASLSVEQFRFYLRSQSETNTGCDWALVDEAGKFLGLVDSPRLLKFLALNVSPAAMGTNEGERDRLARRTLDSLVQLLERLPWPLMLQTGTGDVVTQNPAWRQQFGGLSASEEVRLEVEAILETSFTPGAEVKIQESALPSVVDNSDSSSSHCQLGIQPGTCICVWPSQNGQERAWHFVKIALPISVVSSQLDNGQQTTENKQIWLMLATDVTDQQQLASELAAKNADLIHLNRLKDEFLACISHELKTPLTAVLGLSTLLKDQTLGKLNERQARYAQLIHQSGRHLMSVVNDILDLTRMETGQVDLTLAPVQIATVCDRAIQQARASQAETTQPSKAEQPLRESPADHRFLLVIEPGLDTIVADEFRLRQMLVHLLANAFKFTQSAGEIGLRVSRWEGWIAFTVWDTGIGIPEHKQHLIFQKFQQLENPLTRQFEGTGLGLALTRSLARLHGGDVSFLSKEGKGSQFTLLLPPSPPDDFRFAFMPDLKLGSNAKNPNSEIQDFEGTSQSKIKGKGKQKSKIQNSHRNRLMLVVEAAPRYIEDLTAQLTSLGYWVVIARSGTEALEKARRLQPGAVFLNPLLPLLSGWDVLTLLKSDEETRQIPAIVTATRAEKEQAFSNRADDFLSLPVQQQVLQQLLTRLSAPSTVPQSACTDTPLTILRLVPPERSPLALQRQCHESCYNETAVSTTGLGTHDASRTPVRKSRETGASDWLVFNAGFPEEPISTLPHQSPPDSLLNYQVVEADDLEQAEVLAQIWQPDVVLLERAIPDPLAYLKLLSQYPSLAVLPLVTLDAATTQAANQVTKLSVFPCLTPVQDLTIDALLPVLQFAAGMNWKPSLLVIDVASLSDLHLSSPPTPNTHPAKGSEWFQALIQYLQTAGLRAVMGRSWAEVKQQIRQQNVDLLLICLGDSRLHPDVLEALQALRQQHDVPPILLLEQRLSQGEVSKQFHDYLEEPKTDESSEVRTRDAVPLQATTESLETILQAIACKILPSSLSMEELLDEIHQTLAQTNAQRSEEF